MLHLAYIAALLQLASAYTDLGIHKLDNAEVIPAPTQAECDAVNSTYPYPMCATEAESISETLGLDSWCQYGLEDSPTGLAADSTLFGLYYIVSKDATAVAKDPSAKCSAIVTRLGYHHVPDGPLLLRYFSENLLPGGKIMIIDQELGWSLDEQPKCSSSTDSCTLPSATFAPGNPGAHMIPQTYVMRNILEVDMHIVSQKPWNFYSSAIDSSRAFAIVVPK